MILSRKFLSIGKCSGLRSRRERISDLIEIASRYNDESVRLSHLLFQIDRFKMESCQWKK